MTHSRGFWLLLGSSMVLGHFWAILGGFGLLLPACLLAVAYFGLLLLALLASARYCLLLLAFACFCLLLLASSCFGCLGCLRWLSSVVLGSACRSLALFGSPWLSLAFLASP